MNIQWYPGHMAKTRRVMIEDLNLVDAVCEVIDARIPISSRNPDVGEVISSKPRLVVMNRMDQADPEATKVWAEYFKAQGYAILQTDCKKGVGVSNFSAAVKGLLKDKLKKYAEKGQVSRPIKLMVVGVPNVGKSSLINRLAKRKSAKTEDRPGVTRGRQWITVDSKLELLDMPGMLAPKLEPEEVGMNLAYTGAIKDDIIDIETLACHFCSLLAKKYPEALEDRYGVEITSDMQGWEILEACAKKRGFIISRGEIDYERMAKVLLTEFRDGKLGRITLELPGEYDRTTDEC